VPNARFADFLGKSRFQKKPPNCVLQTAYFEGGRTCSLHEIYVPDFRMGNFTHETFGFAQINSRASGGIALAKRLRK
jgi:hypothetical protein